MGKPLVLHMIPVFTALGETGWLLHAARRGVAYAAHLAALGDARASWEPSVKSWFVAEERRAAAMDGAEFAALPRAVAWCAECVEGRPCARWAKVRRLGYLVRLPTLLVLPGERVREDSAEPFHGAPVVVGAAPPPRPAGAPPWRPYAGDGVPPPSPPPPPPADPFAWLRGFAAEPAPPPPAAAGRNPSGHANPARGPGFTGARAQPPPPPPPPPPRPQDPEGDTDFLGAIFDHLFGGARRRPGGGGARNAGRPFNPFNPFGSDDAGGAAAPPAGPSDLELRRAARQLGVAWPGCTPDEVTAAHKRHALANHPDRGGSTAAMAQYNNARDMLRAALKAAAAAAAPPAGSQSRAG